MVYLKSRKKLLNKFLTKISRSVIKLGGLSREKLTTLRHFWVETIWVVKAILREERKFSRSIFALINRFFSKAEKRVQDNTVFWKSLKMSHTWTKFNLWSIKLIFKLIFGPKNNFWIFGAKIQIRDIFDLGKVNFGFLARKFKSSETFL